MNAIVRRLENGERWWGAELALRAVGLALLALCAAAIVWLYGSVHQLPRHEAGAGELFAGLAAVLGWCLGSSLAVAGQGLFKLVTVPGRHGQIYHLSRGTIR